MVRIDGQFAIHFSAVLLLDSVPAVKELGVRRGLLREATGSEPTYASHRFGNGTTLPQWCVCQEAQFKGRLPPWEEDCKEGGVLPRPEGGHRVRQKGELHARPNQALLPVAEPNRQLVRVVET